MKRFLTAVFVTTCFAAAVAFAGGPSAKIPSANLSKVDLVANPPALPAAGEQPGRAQGRHLDDVIYTEDFETIVSGDLPSGWYAHDIDGGFCNQWNRNSMFEVFDYGRENARSGSRVAMVHYNDGAVANNDWLVLPMVTGGTGFHLHYYSASQDPAFLESYEVRVSTTGHEPADFTTVVETVNDASALWIRHTVDLDAFANQSIYIAFHCTSLDKFVLKFDDIEVATDTDGPTGSIAGVIRRQVDQNIRSVSGAVVTLDGIGVQTHSLDDGSYRFNHVPVGLHSIAVTASGHLPGGLANINVVTGTVTDSANVILSRLSTTTLAYRSLPLGSSLPIYDLDTTAWSIAVSDTNPIWDLNVAIEITHSWMGDLDIWLRSPDGRMVQLYRHNINISGNNIDSTLFDDEAGNYVFFTDPPYPDSVRPANPLAVWDGMPMNGSWTLLVYDNFAEDIGILNDWTLQFTKVTGAGVDGANDTPARPRDFSFAGAFPNPFNPSTDFAFSLERDGAVTLRVFNLAGQQVATLLDNALTAGPHTVHFDAADLPTGVYFAQLGVSGALLTKKIVLLK
jgi:subtilisin-like proprotein convertase family protein